MQNVSRKEVERAENRIRRQVESVYEIQALQNLRFVDQLNNPRKDKVCRVVSWNISTVNVKVHGKAPTSKTLWLGAAMAPDIMMIQ